MEVITCPNCGKLLEYPKGTSRHASLTVWCPQCGEVPLLEDSQIITISDGQFRGPGLFHLEENAEDISIHEGKIVSGKQKDTPDEEESIIKVETRPSVPVDNTSFKGNLASGTVEEKFDFEWKAESKEVGHRPPTFTPAQGVTKNQGVQKRKTERIYRDRIPTRPGMEKSKPSDRLQSTQRNTKRIAGIKSPWYYYAIFYGVPSGVIFLLMVLVCYKWGLLNFLRPSRPLIVLVGPHEIWKKAEESYSEAYVCYEEALVKRSTDKKGYLEKLRKADQFYQKALELGQNSWEEQIKLVSEQKKLSKEEAEKYAQEHYGKFQEKMQLWQQKHRLVKQDLSLVEEKRKP
jgi:phage FluMu protein Com